MAGPPSHHSSPPASTHHPEHPHLDSPQPLPPRDHLIRGNPLTLDPHPESQQQPSPRRDHETHVPVHKGQGREPRPVPQQHRPLRDRPRAPQLGRHARRQYGGVGVPDDIGGEYVEECAEVTAPRGGQERLDDLPMPVEYGARHHRRAPHWCRARLASFFAAASLTRARATLTELAAA